MYYSCYMYSITIILCLETEFQGKYWMDFLGIREQIRVIPVTTEKWFIRHGLPPICAG